LNTLRGFGVLIKPVKNTREISWLNLQNYVLDNAVTFGHANGHEELGLPTDKETSFADLMQQRQKSRWR
jgi:hypothetical protein